MINKEICVRKNQDECSLWVGSRNLIDGAQGNRRKDGQLSRTKRYFELNFIGYISPLYFSIHCSINVNHDRFTVSNRSMESHVVIVTWVSVSGHTKRPLKFSFSL